jgi:hypothetical protein
MLRLSSRRRELLSDKFADAANVALGALVFGQFVSEQPYSTTVAVVGFSIWLALTSMAVLMTGGRGGS